MARALSHREPPVVQRVVSYTWDWYTWTLGWKAGAEALWRKIDLTCNKELLPLIAKLEATLGENEVYDLIEFRDRYDGTKIAVADGKAFLEEAEAHLGSARAIAGRPSTKPTTVDAPPITVDKPETEDPRPPPPEPVKGLVAVGSGESGSGRGGAGHGAGGRGTKEGRNRPGAGHGVGRGGGDGEGGVVRGKRPVEGPVEEGQFDDAVEEEPVEEKVDEEVEKEPVKEEAGKEPVVDAAVVDKPAPTLRKKLPGKGRKAGRRKTKKKDVAEELPASPVGVMSPTAREMAAERKSKVDRFRAAMAEFDEDHRPLVGKGKPLLAMAEAAVRAIRVLEGEIADYQETIDARRADVEAQLDEEDAELEVIQDLSDELVLLETLFREGLIEHLGIDEEVTDLEGEIDLRLNDAAAGAEVIRLRKLWRSEAAARGHFMKHSGDTGLATEQAYLAAAEALVAGGPNVRSKVRSNGDTAFFDTVTGRFSSVSSSGTIRTLFCPGGGQNGLAYYNRQT